MPAPILTATLNPCIDKTFTVDRVVTDRKLKTRDVARYPGGGGLNVARVVVRLGHSVLALWTCGGPLGELLADLLEREAVPHQPIRVAEHTRENLIVLDASTGEQYRFSLPGPSLEPGDLEAWSGQLSSLDPTTPCVVLSGSLPPGASPEWFGRLVERIPSGVPLVVDTKDAALACALEAGVFLVKPNIHELEQLVGRELAGDRAVAEAATEIVDRGGAEVVLVSLGRGGAMLVTGDGVEHLRAPAVPLGSKVGAGDSMVGGLAVALARGRELLDAARYAVAAGAAAVMTPGTELCRPDDVERLYRQMTSQAAESGQMTG